MFCPNCGHQCPDHAKFCENCGAVIPAGAQNRQNFSYDSQYRQTSYACPRGGAPIARRSIAMCIVLSLVTCGIYGIYWFICLANDLNTADDRPGDTSGGMAFLLGLVTCGIYTLYWSYKAGEKVADIQYRYTGRQGSHPGVVYLLLNLVGLGIVAWALIQSELNQVASC